MSTGINIGPLTIKYYGIIMAVGIIAAAVLSYFLAKKRGRDPEVIFDSLTWIVIGGVVGARIWHILTPSASLVAQGITTQYYLTHPLAAIAIWRGGLGIPGAVAGGSLAFFIYSKKKKISFWAWADIFAPAVALGQAIGRWGNFINQEVYGSPSTLPWAITIAPENRLPEFQQYATYHPLFLYESLFNFLNMGLLIWVGRKFQDKLKDGDIFLIYLISYPIYRFFMEYLRLDNSYVGGINANQTMMLVVAVLSAGVIVWRHLKKDKPADDKDESGSESEPTEVEK
ncbi:MAG: prolipoprotein diacylglyceryl transferase [Anaerolineaceae bacterium]|nr:prolipoprotein diacylglyceryl transferase [Anaerolineaceae bacterium]